jgi:hypothetical protein
MKHEGKQVEKCFNVYVIVCFVCTLMLISKPVSAVGIRAFVNVRPLHMDVIMWRKDQDKNIIYASMDGYAFCSGESLLGC